MIIATQSQLNEISRYAEESYPSECCGLLSGLNLPGTTDIRITRVVPSENVSQTDTRDSFEVDPKVRFDLMRMLEGRDECIVGHYHSHPDHPAEPSAMDISMIYEPELFWMIASTNRKRETDIRAYIPTPDATTFTPATIRIIKE